MTRATFITIVLPFLACRAEAPRPATPQLGGHHLGETWATADHLMPCMVDTLRTMDSRHGTVQRTCSADGIVTLVYNNDTLMLIRQLKDDSGGHDLWARWEAQRREATATLGTPDSVATGSIGSHRFIKAFWRQAVGGWQGRVVIDEGASQVGTFLTSLSWLERS